MKRAVEMAEKVSKHVFVVGVSHTDFLVYSMIVAFIGQNC